MDVKKLALLVGALVIAVVTAVMAKNMKPAREAMKKVVALRMGRRHRRNNSRPQHGKHAEDK